MILTIFTTIKGWWKSNIRLNIESESQPFTIRKGVHILNSMKEIIDKKEYKKTAELLIEYLNLGDKKLEERLRQRLYSAIDKVDAYDFKNSRK